MEIIEKSGPGEDPFVTHARHMLLKATKQEARSARPATSISTPMPTIGRCSATTCTRCRRKSRTRIGTSTLFAAWNAAAYVAQIEDTRLAQVITDSRYLDATAEVLHQRGGLWFYDDFFPS